MKDTKLLNAEQEKAVRHGGGPLLIIAGAGTGKTTVITERIKYLILEKNVAPTEILALTFTEKSALEMEERVDIAMPYGYTQMWISTFHAFCDRVLRNDSVQIGLNPGYKLSTETQSILFLRKNIFKFNLSYFRPLGNPDKFLQGMLQHFSRLKDEDVNPSQYLEYANTLKSDPDEVKKTLELAHAYKTYEDIKIKEGVMDFSDLISNTLTLFRTRKNVLREYQEKFKFVLIDEFQDTNYAQNTLAILLAGKNQNITVVGDDDQAIYRWRGAAISNMIQFKEHFPNTKIITLIRNYRSTKQILDSSYTLIQHNNPDRLEIKEKVNKKLIPERHEKGKEIELLQADRIEDEADLVALKIKELMENNTYSYKDFAVLVRANDHAQPFSKAFLRHGMPYQFLGPGRLFQQEEIKDLIAYLKVLYNFEDSSSLYRVLNLPILDFDSRDIAAILNFARRKNISLFVAIEKIVYTNEEAFLSEDVVKKLEHIYKMIKKHLNLLPKETAGQIVYYFLQDTGFLKILIDQDKSVSEKVSQNIAKFFEKLRTFEADHDDASVFAVIEWIDLAIQLGESPLSSDIDWSETNAINILTLHSSKGLEFPNVFLVNLVTGRFPTRERHEQIPIPQALIKEILPSGDFHIQEERRLFYVGMTRARDNLFFTYAHFYGEGKRERKLSPYIYDAMDVDFVSKTIEAKKIKRTGIQESLLEWNPEKREEKAAQEVNALNKITYISYSQLQTFDVCPLHYKLKYILKIPTPQSASQSFGTSIHSVLRDYYYLFAKGQKITKQTIPELLKKDWIEEGYTSKQHQQHAKERALDVVTKYIEQNFNKDMKPQDIILETPFQFFISSENRKEGIKIGGRIDRIDTVPDGKIEIIDYKTGSNIPNEKKLSEDLQLTVYALAALHVKCLKFQKKPEDILLSLHYVEEDKKFTTTRTAQQLEEAKEKIFAKVAEIETSKFLCSHSALCLNCEYKMLCDTI